MATYTWSIPAGNAITSSTKVKDTDNYIANTIDDLVDFVNGEGEHIGAGLTYDLVDKANSQTITGAKTFSSPIVANGGVTGNVTGNTSGSSGSCTGNSATATKLATARTIAISGGATGSASFDGSADINISISSSFPSGGIIIWSGSSSAIPSGWYLCNGLNGTPNLQDRFIVGAGSSYSVGATGGSKDATLPAHSHTATVTDNGHSHGTIVDGPSGCWAAGGCQTFNRGVTSTKIDLPTSTTGITVANSTTGSSATNANLPPYYALCYIMKA